MVIGRNRGASLLAALLVLAAAPAGAERLDGIVAVVNDEVIVESELAKEINLVVPQLEGRGTQVPPREVLERQVIERLILKRLQIQEAKRLGIEVDDATLTQALENIANRNGLTLEDLRVAVEAGGIRFDDFREDTRMQILTSRLQSQEIAKNIQVTDQEVARFLEREAASLIERTGVRFSHILIAVDEDTPSEVVDKAQQKARDLVRQLRAGADFAALAARDSDGRQALEGGDLGWFSMGEVPSLLQDLSRTMAKGEVSEPLRSPSGFHVVKLTDIKGSEPEVVTQTNARHILVRTNELVSDADAQTRLAQLRLRIIGGDDFATLARSHSEDTGTALRGGDLGWVSPGDTVPEFEKAMDALAPKDVSQPFKSTFGWHIVQVLERRRQDTTEEAMRNKARAAIRQRKADEATDLWLRRLRDEAYVEMRVEEPE
ncbi:MAG: peptidylprolyl isomerase [Chromatiaceae bacterium]|jgi:peptidyl-prolyl cis-trans isomerase SurA|nr:peptidylprolyl isomerase [Chromatiaceae bacterium]